MKKSIFISLIILSVFMSILGVFFINFNNKKVSNYADQKNLIQPMAELKTLEQEIIFNANFLSNDDEINQEITVNVNWSINTPSTDKEEYVKINIHDNVAKTDFDPFDKIWKGTVDNKDPFTSTQVGDKTLYELNVVINGNKIDDEKDYPFEENGKYIITSTFFVNEGEYAFSTRFVAPSKSKIDFTEDAGTILDISQNSVTIDTSYKQESQIPNIFYPIDEKLSLKLIETNDNETDDNLISEIDIDASEIVIDNLDSLEWTNYSKWRIVGSYYNGIEMIDISVDVNEFQLEDGITYTVSNIDQKSDSIFVTLEIKNDDQLPVDAKFYNNDIELNSNLSFAEHSGVSSVNADVVWGTVIYEITGLDYNTEYNINLQINDNFTRQVNSDSTIKTLDKYVWTVPFSIVLLIIVLIELIATTSIWILLFGNIREK